MVSFTLSIPMPWSSGEFRPLWSRAAAVTKLRAFEIEFYRDAVKLIQIRLRLDWTGRDHAGPEIELGLFGYVCAMRLYSTRHWDYSHNCWDNH